MLFATGAQTDRRMGIPGEDLTGSHPATEFVAWYNGHPDYRDHQFDLSVERAQTMKAFGAELILTPRSGGMEYARDLADPSALKDLGVEFLVKPYTQAQLIGAIGRAVRRGDGANRECRRR